MKNKYQQYKDTLRKVADIEFSIALLSWDQEVNMPSKGSTFRSQQMATLSGISHEISTAMNKKNSWMKNKKRISFCP